MIGAFLWLHFSAEELDCPLIQKDVHRLPGDYSKNSTLETTMSTQDLAAKTASSKPP